MVHHGLADEALARRHATMLAAYQAPPERFVRGAPRRPELPQAVWINPPKGDRSAGPQGESDPPVTSAPRTPNGPEAEA